MKKLVIAFAACALAGLASAQVYSQNIVGYTTKGVAANQKIIAGAQFVEVGEAGLDLSSIKLENVPANDSASIQWWNGSAYESAVWTVLDWGDGDIAWGDENTDLVNHTFAPGEGFWIMLPGGVMDAKVTQAGEVALSSLATYDFNVEANKKYLVINPLPTGLNLSDIALLNVPANDSASIQWWNGSAYESAVWTVLDWGDGDIAWGDENTDLVSHTFAPGEGFWIMLPGGVIDAKVKIANKVTQ